MRVFQTFETAFALQRGALFPWAPVMLACGIGLYFSLTFELTHPTYTALFVIFIMASGVALRGGLLVQVCAGAVALIVLGVLLAGFRAHAVAGPVLGFRYYGPVEGRIIAMDRSGSDALRLLLDQVVLADTAPQKVPRRVRVSLHGPQGFVALAPGQRVMMNAHLAAPAGPVEPGGFDFRRHAWFLGIGAVGYTRTPVVLAVAGREGVWLGQLRHRLSQRVQARIPGDAGGFAAAILTGDRSAVAQPRLEALRDSNLAHLLAISGLHMGLLAGFVFATIRGGLALCPPLALRLPARKIAAVFAMAAGAFYLALSGGNVATERAFSMVAVMLCAVLLDRRALSLRSVAVAGLVVLALRPEALAGPGFQMSFAATTALVVVFGWLSQHRPNSGWMAQKWLRLALGVLVSSGIAGLATAPLGAAHFNQIAHYGLLANLAAVPLMGALIMPAAVIGICLMPLGLDGVPLWVMGQGLAWVLFVADTVAAWPGATSGVPTPPAAVLPMMALGALWAVLWRGRWALLGGAPMVMAFALWATVQRPVVLVADSGRLVGVMGPEGRALSGARGQGFVARVWLENDGEIATSQETAAARWPTMPVLGQGRLMVLRGEKAAQAASCLPGDWVVSDARLPAGLPCQTLDADRLQTTGAIALYATPDGGLRMRSVAQMGGLRLWHGQR